MPKFKERPELKSENFDTVRFLDSETKMGIILSVFDLGKDEEQNKKRKADFIKLMGRYYESGVKHRASKTPDSNITSSEITSIHSFDENKKKLHNQIMETLRIMSLSLGPSKDQRLLAEYLTRNREEVERLIVYYFTGKDVALSKSAYISAKQGIDSINNKFGREEE